jgi:hypothetical protein
MAQKDQVSVRFYPSVLANVPTFMEGLEDNTDCQKVWTMCLKAAAYCLFLVEKHNPSGKEQWSDIKKRD